MRHLLNAVQLPDVVQRVQRRRDATVHADDLVLDDGGHRQIVEGISEELPHSWSAVRPHALVEEAVNLRDLAALVVATEQSDALLVADLVQEHQGHCLHRVIAAVHVIAKEKVIALRRKAPKLKHPQQVVVLAMDVANYFDRCLQLQQGILLHEDIPGHFADRLQLTLLRELCLVVRPLAFALEHVVQNLVQVDPIAIGHLPQPFTATSGGSKWLTLRGGALPSMGRWAES
mmetsp:Transcript_61100/g.169408  ORF Transcript_61100/g.169408 Transcript_61100/m.169408 type:complete len:231 (+) Transcript_61100:521-1213(+)